ncbi:MAG: OmcA/MtrC family decaheme c-type cytochrome [Steroidobacteraceae bacterium]
MPTRLGTDARRRTCAALIPGVMLAALLAACSGSTGAQGAAGTAGATGPTGPGGPTGPVTGLDVTTATAITGTITSVTIPASGQPVVNFELVDQTGAPLSGLPAADIGLVIANLTPGTNGMSSYWTSYIYQTVTPKGCPAGATSCLAAAATQPTTESGTTGTLVDNGNGTYVYTFNKNVTTDPLVKYDATLTHRVGFEIRGLAQANNGAYTFQPSTGATTNIFSREIVETSTCDNCHGFLNAHGGARVEVRYCVMCHSPQNTDPYSGNPLDFKRQIHKIHTGINLPSIAPAAVTFTAPPSGTAATLTSAWTGVSGANYNITFSNGQVSGGGTFALNSTAVSWTTPVFGSPTAKATAQDVGPTLGQGYWIVGYMESLNNFNTVLFPQDTRNCQTCHVQNLAGATEAGNYASVPTMEACGACHDNVNFATGANHSTNIVANDTQCVTCHGPSSNLDNGQLTAVAAHVIPDVVAATRYQFNVNSVTFSFQAGSTYPVVNISVTDPTNKNQPYNLLTEPTFVGNGILANQQFGGVQPTVGTSTPVCTGDARLAIDVGWDTSDYTNWNTAAPAAATWGQPLSINPLVPGAGSVPAGCSASTLAYGGASVPAPPAPSTMYGPLADGSFTIVGAALPAPPTVPPNCPPASSTACAPIQNVVAVLEGHPGVVTTTPASADRVGVTTAVGYGNTTGATPVPRRTIVDIAKCDVCHSVLQLHGDNRNDNPQACVVCHNPASTDVSQRLALTAPGIDGLWEQAIDFKHHIHEIHSDAWRQTQPNYTPWIIYGFGGGINNFSDVVFPQDSGNCYACHSNPPSGPTFYPGDALMQAMTTDTGLSTNPMDATTPGNPISTSPTMAACTGCHEASLVISHMLQNGGSTDVLKDAEGRMIPGSGAGVETCAVCHGPGGVADVGKVHNVIPSQP